MKKEKNIEPHQESSFAGRVSFSGEVGSRLLIRPMPAILVYPDILPGGVKDAADKLGGYLKDPSTLVTGLRSTGTRADAISGWKERCRKEGETVKENLKKHTTSREWYVWDHVPNAEITTRVKLTWSYDKCFIYDADATLVVQRNDEPEDMGVILLESYAIPETDPVELGICKCCTPTCLKVVLTILFYAAGVGSVPGISKQLNIKVLLCPSDSKTPGFEDNTDYQQNQGNSDGPQKQNDKPLPPPIKPHGVDPGTFGVARRDPANTKGSGYYPRDKYHE